MLNHQILEQKTPPVIHTVGQGERWTAISMRIRNASLISTLVLPLLACGGGGSSDAVPVATLPVVEESVSCLAEHPFVTDFDQLIDDQELYTYSTFDGDEPPVAPNLYRDAPSAAGLPAPAGVGAVACATNNEFRFGVARSDITGPWAGRSRAGYEAPVNTLSGLAQRAYARAFVISEDCSGKSVVLINTDLGFMHRSVRDAVMLRLAADPELSAIDPNSMLLTATHTHNISGGYSHDLFFSGLHGGHQKDVLDTIVDGIVEAIAQAWAQAGIAEPGRLALAFDELLHTNANRHPSGYLQNPESERAQYLDINGKDQTTNLLATQLNLLSSKGDINGIINWFSVHPTASLDGTLASGDSKGYAAYLLERSINSQQTEGRAKPFVAGILQSDEGDVVPIRYLDNVKEGLPRLPPLITQALGDDVLDVQANIAISGVRQAANALKLIETDDAYTLHGSIDYRMRYEDFTDEVITDPVVLASLLHPPELDVSPKRTCDPLYGVSSVGKEAFGKYQSCADGLNVPLEEFLADLQNGDVQRSVGDAAKIALCTLGDLDLSPAGGADYSCQAEKAHLFGMGDKGPIYTQVDQPFQILRIGNFAVIALPWEITTMAGRRIRETVLQELRAVGVDFVVIAGLANEYTSYLTTREEYARQGYEASSNVYGPWTLAAVQQQLREIALNMAENQPGLPAEGIDPIGARMPSVLAPADALRVDVPTRGSFASVIGDVSDSYLAGQKLSFSYQAAFPNNDSYRNSSYFEIQRRIDDSNWVIWRTDADPETILNWQSNSPGAYIPPSDSVLEIQWFVAYDTPPGLYRIVYRTTAKELPVDTALTAYESVSRTFEVINPTPQCAAGH